MSVPKIFETIAEEISKPARSKFAVRRVISNFPDDIWASDLVQMTSYTDKNNGYAYMLNVIDVFTRYAWSVPLKSKEGEEVLRGLKEIVAKNDGNTPKFLWTDEGKEYYNNNVKKWCDANNIKLYSSHGSHKSCIVERFNRTIKTSMWKRLIANNNRNWVSILPALVNNYNNHVHSSLGMTPAQAMSLDTDGISDLWFHQFGDVPHKNLKPPKFKVGDYVRIARKKNIFEKGYLPSWTMEIFRIRSVAATVPWTYHIEDLRKEPITGSFYEPELQITEQNPESEFLVEKVLDTRKFKGRKQVLVKWLGYSDKFNRWIDA
jgi:hypothetical protein